MTYEVRANWKVIAENYNECYHCAGVHPELVRLVPAFGHGGADLDWDGGVPLREGAWTFTATGTSNRRPFEGLDEDEQVRHKGELIYPNLMISLSADHVAAFRLVPTAAGHTTIECDILVDPAELEPPGRRPVRRGRLLGHGQPAGLGDLRVGAARDVLARLHAGLVRADGGREPRHPALAAAPAGALVTGRRCVEVDVVVVGLGALGSATSWQLARRGASVVGLEQFALGHARGASHDTSRIIRHSYHTPGYVELTFAAYDDWADLEARFRAVAGDHHRRHRPLPGRRRDRRWTPTPRAWTPVRCRTTC